LFIGRLSAEKGLHTLAEAVRQLRSVQIDVYGKGPLQNKYAETHPEAMLAMGRTAREVYLERYTPETNYVQMIRIYHEALASRAAPSDPPALSDATLSYAPTRTGR